MTHLAPQADIPTRILIPQARACPSRPVPTPREIQRRAYIMEAATSIFATHGRAFVTMRAFADATGLAQSTIRRHVGDMHHLFGLILAAHLDALLAAITKIPAGAAGQQARRRAEYCRITRAQCAAGLHRLFLQERFMLPADERAPLEQQRRLIGIMLAGQAWEEILPLLDNAALDATKIETMIAAAATLDATRRLDAAAPVHPAQAALSLRPPVKPRPLIWLSPLQNAPPPFFLRAVPAHAPPA